MTWFDVVGMISTIALSLPIIFILTLRLAWYKSFPALLVYYSIAFGYNFLYQLQGYISINETFLRYYGILCNLLDVPLMLAFMTYFSRTASFRKKMELAIPVFVLFELIIIAIYKFNTTTTTIVLGPGLLMALVLSLIFFFHQAKITVVHQRAPGKAFMVSGLLFAYGGYSFIYVVYYLLKTTFRDDTFIVYYLTSTFSSLLICAGLYFERKRVKQIAEIQIARKELKVIYGGKENNTAISKEQPC